MIFYSKVMPLIMLFFFVNDVVAQKTINAKNNTGFEVRVGGISTCHLPLRTGGYEGILGKVTSANCLKRQCPSGSLFIPIGSLLQFDSTWAQTWRAQ